MFHAFLKIFMISHSSKNASVNSFIQNQRFRSSVTTPSAETENNGNTSLAPRKHSSEWKMHVLQYRWLSWFVGIVHRCALWITLNFSLCFHLFWFLPWHSVFEEIASAWLSNPHLRYHYNLPDSFQGTFMKVKQIAGMVVGHELWFFFFFSFTRKLSVSALYISNCCLWYARPLCHKNVLIDGITLVIHHTLCQKWPIHN